MKKLVLTLTAMTLASAGAFAQGRVSFQTDTSHLAYYDPSVNGVGGTAISSGNVAAGATGFMADLYMGTSSSSLSLYASTTFTATPGKWGTVSVKADGTTAYNTAAAGPQIAGGTTVFIVTQVRDGSGPAEATLTSAQLQTPLAVAAANDFNFIGFSQEFTFTLGTSSISYPFMYTTASWAPGTFDLSSSAGSGAKGAIAVLAVPEPTSLALAGLGIAAGLILRRRK